MFECPDHSQRSLKLGRKSLQRQWYFVLQDTEEVVAARPAKNRTAFCESKIAPSFIDQLKQNHPSRNASAGFVVICFRDIVS
jgi:hypothetical protein